MTTAAPFDPAQLRQVFGQFPSGVAAVAAVVDGLPVGLAVSSFTSVSLDPPLVSVCVAHSSTTWPVLRPAPRLGLSVLGADQEAVCRALSARDVDRFATLSWRAGSEGAVLLDGAGAWLECSVHAQHRAGDHDIVVLQVEQIDADQAVAPLVFHGSRFRRLAG